MKGGYGGKRDSCFPFAQMKKKCAQIVEDLSQTAGRTSHRAGTLNSRDCLRKQCCQEGRRQRKDLGDTKGQAEPGHRHLLP